MPVDIAAFRQKGVEVKLKFWGDTIKLMYDPITVGDPTRRDERAETYRTMRQEIVARAKPSDADELPDEDPDIEIERASDRLGWADVNRPLITMACSMVRSWDLTDNGEPVPLEVESFENYGLPVSLAAKIIQVVTEDVDQLGNPNGSRPTASG